MLLAKLRNGVNPMRVMIALSVLLFILGLTFFGTVMRQYKYDTLSPLRISQPAEDSTSTGEGNAAIDVDDPAALLYHLWRPMVHGITDRTFRAVDGKDHTLPDGPLNWTEPLGKKVLILDVDSRFVDAPGNLLNQSDLHRDQTEKKTAGRLAHLVYSMIHGYDYRFVRAPNFQDRWGTWAKVPILREAARTYDTVVFLDADAGFVHMDLPLEWLMNYWGVTKETSMALAKDPDSETNRDSKGLVLLNTGFIITQKNDRTQEILQALEDCPNDERWEGCSKWKNDWAHEQRAFGEYVRYDYTEATDILPLRMPEANGPGGLFIRHDWPKQRDPLEDLQKSFMEFLVKRTHRHFHEKLDQYYRDFFDKKHPLADLEV